MSLTVSGTTGSDNKDYERVEAGVYPGRCIRLVDLGTHVTKFLDKESQEPVRKREIEIVWELSELMEDGRPFVVSWKGFPSIGSKANLGKLLVSWRGKPFTEDELKGFSLKNILDACCLVNVTKTQSKKDPSKYFNNVESVMPMMKGMVMPERVNELFDFDLDRDINDQEKINKLWPRQKTLVTTSDEWIAFHGNTGNEPQPEAKPEPTADHDNDLPF